LCYTAIPVHEQADRRTDIVLQGHSHAQGGQPDGEQTDSGTVGQSIGWADEQTDRQKYEPSLPDCSPSQCSISNPLQTDVMIEMDGQT
jgi:hypothetical protein